MRLVSKLMSGESMRSVTWWQVTDARAHASELRTNSLTYHTFELFDLIALPYSLENKKL